VVLPLTISAATVNAHFAANNARKIMPKSELISGAAS
jgi:hypothetical protein